MEKNYQVCTETIMDTTDSRIRFDALGRSDYYLNFQNKILPEWQKNLANFSELQKKAEKIREQRKNEEFDCILGISGGLDSCYTAYVLKEKLGLRPLLFHVDAGWNTNQAVANIEKIVNGLQLDLYTEVINWQQMKNLHRAFLKSGIPDQDLPQDYVFFSALYSFAHKNNIKYVATGANVSTECIREPEEWGAYPGVDTTLVKDIMKKCGDGDISGLPIVDILRYKVYYQKIRGMEIIKPLDFVPYVKKDAEKLLHEKFGWEKFQHKHHESRFTRFFEDFWLREKFGFDKRKAHFSSLILTGQMTRDEALERIKSPEMTEEFFKNEFDFIASKLDFTTDELWQIFRAENRTYRDYRNKKGIVDLGKKMLTISKSEKRLFR